MTPFANVVFPAFRLTALPHFVLLTVALLAIEALVLRLCIPRLPGYAAIGWSLAMNAISAACGWIWSPWHFDPSALDAVSRHLVVVEGQLFTWSLARFAAAWALSTLIEAGVALPFLRKYGLKRVGVAVVLANALSYALLLLLLCEVFALRTGSGR